MNYIKPVLGWTLIMLVALCVSTTNAAAQNKDAKVRAEAAKTAGDATTALNELMKIPAKSIPESLLKKAKAIAVFPNVIKAAFIIGGRGGKGLISRRVKGGWSAPAMFTIGGGSVGFQIGASSTDVVMLFMTDESLNSLLLDKFEIGGEAAAAAGPVGRTARATTDALLQAAILSYSRSKGVFAGVSISGAVISPDNNENQALYSLDAKELLTGENKVAIASIPSETKQFQKAVTRHAK
jgi:lipid-binding SYLF domain-containing protein